MKIGSVLTLVLCVFVAAPAAAQTAYRLRSQLMTRKTKAPA